MIPFQHEKHKLVWNWLSENPGYISQTTGYTILHNKINAFNKLKDELNLGSRYPVNCCYACDFIVKNNLVSEYGSFLCELCPLKWSEKECVDAEYKIWSYAKTLEERSKAAKVIADLRIVVME